MFIGPLSNNSLLFGIALLFNVIGLFTCGFNVSKLAFLVPTQCGCIEVAKVVSLRSFLVDLSWHVRSAFYMCISCMSVDVSCRCKLGCLAYVGAM